MRSGRLISSIFIIGISLIFITQGYCAEAQQPAESKKTAEPNGPQPKIEFEQVVHDFGSISPNTSHLCEFKFENNGAGILKIEEVTKTCGCTVFTLEKKEFAPGEKGTLKVQYNADDRAGPRKRNLYVLSNAPNSPRMELTIRATIVQKVVYEPERVDFKVKGHDAEVAELTIKSVDDVPFEITKFESTSDAVTADFDPNRKDSKFVLKTRIDPQKMGFSTNGRLEITVTHPEITSLVIPFNVLPTYSVEPPAINVLNAVSAQSVRREVWLLNNYGDDFDVNSATSREGIVKVVGREKVGNRYKFDLEITPPAKTNETRMFTDTFTINTKDGATINVACRGFYRRK